MRLGILGDLSAAISQLRRRPLFVVGSSLSLALGMALATALFSIIDSALLRPLPYSRPEQLVELYVTTPAYNSSRISTKLIDALRQGSASFTGVAAYTTSGGMLGARGEAHAVRAVAVTSNFFDVLRVKPLRGVPFSQEDVASDDHAAIISFSLWTAAFGANPNVVGKTIQLSGKLYTISGVMPSTFDMPAGTQVWLHLPNREIVRDAADGPDVWAPYYAIARLSPTATMDQASAETAVTYRRIYGSVPENRFHSARVISLAEHVTANLRDQLRLWGAAAILILILCAVNFATMSLARGMRRRDDIAVRSALGASRGRIVRMLVSEAMLLALLGGVLSVILATWLGSYIGALVAEGPLGVAVTISWRTVAFSVALTLAVGFVFALAPAMELAAVDLRTLMQAGSHGTTSRGTELRGRRSLVALQLALALTAVATITALIKADRRFVTSNLGYDYTHLVVANVFGADSSVKRFDVQAVIEQLRPAPGVVDVAATGSQYSVAVIGESDAMASGPPMYVAHVSPTFFATLGLAPVVGRLPTTDEMGSRADVILLSESTAVSAFGSSAAAVGKILRVKQPRQRTAAFTVVGVVPDIERGNGLYGFSSPIYSVHPLRTEPGGGLVMRVDGDPQHRLRDIARAMATVDSRIAVGELRTAQSIVDRVVGETRGRTIFLVTVGALALFLAVVGVYSLTAYTTELRARELGIRLALGAGKLDVGRVVLGELWWMALLGVAVGVAASSQLVSFLDGIFRNPMARVPLVTLPVAPTIATAAALLVILLVGTAVPIRRVLTLDVMRTIQAQ